MKNVFTFLLLFFVASSLFASHYTGAALRYECLGGCTYRIYLTTYLDCSGAAAGSYVQPLTAANPYPAPTSMTAVGNTGCTVSPVSGTWVLDTWADVTPVCSSITTQCNVATAPVSGMAESTYYKDYNLCNVGCTSVKFSWSNCCLGYALTSGAGGNSLYTEVNVDLAAATCNHSPEFTTAPPIYIPAGKTSYFSQAAFDLDGDSLVYSLTPTLQSASSPVTYNLGYSATSPLGPSWNVSIDSHTGLLTFGTNPGNIVSGMLGIWVREFRNGLCIDTIRRDIQVTVMSSGGGVVNLLPTYTISNITGATQSGNTTNVYASVPMGFDITATDANAGQLLSYASTITSLLPTASLTGIANTNPLTLHFSWTPSAGNVGNYYPFLLDIFDSNCPIVGHTSYFTKLNVLASPPPLSIDSIIVSNLCNGMYNFNPIITGGIQPFTYTWAFSGTTTNAFTSNPSLPFPTAGIYTDTAFVTATDMNGMTGTFSQAFTVNPVPVASFTTSPSSSCCAPAVILFAYTGLLSAGSWTWDLGDGSSSSLQTLGHIYTSLGIYNACLIVANLDGCKDTACQTINIGTGVDLDGYIYTGNAVADSFEVFLIQHDTTGGGTLTAIDSQFVYGSPAYYNFANISPAIYYTKAAILSSSANYTTYIPTYHDSSLFWINATPINFLSVPPAAPSGDIYMVAGTNPGGPGFIGGLIAQGANKTLQGAAAGKEIILLNNNNQPVAYTYTDGNGAFAFNNLAYGTYKIHPEVLNKTTFEHTVTISASVPTITDGDMIISHDSIYAYTILPITPPSSVFNHIGSLHPNPTQGLSSIEFSLSQNQIIHFTLSTTLGQVLWENEKNFTAGKQSQNFDMQSFTQGIYFLTIKDEAGRNIVQKVIKE